MHIFRKYIKQTFILHTPDHYFMYMYRMVHKLFGILPVCMHFTPKHSFSL